MKRLLVLLWLCVLAHMQNVSNSSEEEEEEPQPKVSLFFERVRIHGDHHFMKTYAYIHEDRKFFDVFIKLDRKLGSNYLIMNINMRAKFAGSNDFMKLFELRHMDFCAFANNPSFRQFFMSTTHISKVLECPIQEGNYSIENIGVMNIVSAGSLSKGTYKFFTEIVEVTGDIPKIFAMQVTTLII